MEGSIEGVEVRNVRKEGGRGRLKENEKKIEICILIFLLNYE